MNLPSRSRSRRAEVRPLVSSCEREGQTPEETSLPYTGCPNKPRAVSRGHGSWGWKLRDELLVNRYRECGRRDAVGHNKQVVLPRRQGGGQVKLRRTPRAGSDGVRALVVSEGVGHFSGGEALQTDQRIIGVTLVVVTVRGAL